MFIYISVIQTYNSGIRCCVARVKNNTVDDVYEHIQKQFFRDN